MSFMPRLSPEDKEQLFQLYCAAHTQVGVTPKEARAFQLELSRRLHEIWDAIDPKPMPLTFNDFRRGLIEEFLERLRKQNPGRQRPRF
jgi:hypothetical protein